MYRQLIVCSAVAAVLALPSAAAAGGPQPGDLLGSTGAVGSSLILIDPMTAASAPIGALGSFGPVSEIEFRADGVLFGTTGQGSANLVTIDPATGGETLVGMHDLFGAANGLEFVGSTLYASYFGPPLPTASEGGQTDGGATLLVTIDQTDASLTVIGPITGFSPVRGLAYDETAGIMYGIGLPAIVPPPSAGAPEGLFDVLFTVNLATGAPTVIGSTGEFLGALEFGPDGVLYAGEASIGGPPGLGAGWGSGSGSGASAPEGGATLFTIDTASGAATPVGATSAGAISGLSFVPGGEPGGGGSVLEIPALSKLGLLLLAGLLAAAGLFAVRRS